MNVFIILSIWKLTRFIQKVFATKILLSGKFLLFLTLIRAEVNLIIWFQKLLSAHCSRPLFTFVNFQLLFLWEVRFLTATLDWARFFPNPLWVSIYVRVLDLDDEENAHVHLESSMMRKMEKIRFISKTTNLCPRPSLSPKKS